MPAKKAKGLWRPAEATAKSVRQAIAFGQVNRRPQPPIAGVEELWKCRICGTQPGQKE